MSSWTDTIFSFSKQRYSLNLTSVLLGFFFGSDKRTPTNSLNYHIITKSTEKPVEISFELDTINCSFHTTKNKINKS